MPFSYADLFETATKGVRSQNELAQESSEVADFWNMLQGFQTSGKCVDKAHYRIRYMKSFRPISVKEDIEFKEARPILYLNLQLKEAFGLELETEMVSDAQDSEGV